MSNLPEASERRQNWRKCQLLNEKIWCLAKEIMAKHEGKCVGAVVENPVGKLLEVRPWMGTAERPIILQFFFVPDQEGQESRKTKQNPHGLQIFLLGRTGEGFTAYGEGTMEAPNDPNVVFATLQLLLDHLKDAAYSHHINLAELFQPIEERRRRKSLNGHKVIAGEHPGS